MLRPVSFVPAGRPVCTNPANIYETGTLAFHLITDARQRRVSEWVKAFAPARQEPSKKSY